MEKFRSKTFCLLLYPLEDETHKKAIEYIENNYDYALIVHDKDIDEEGKIKKAHTHIVLKPLNAKWNTALADELELSLNYIQKCRGLENALDYLIHFNDDTKHQYDIETVKGTLKQKLKQRILNDKKDENDKCHELIEYIESYEGYLRFINFAKHCSKIGMWDVFRRASVIYLEIIREHNQMYVDTQTKNKELPIINIMITEVFLILYGLLIVSITSNFNILHYKGGILLCLEIDVDVKADLDLESY